HPLREPFYQLSEPRNQRINHMPSLRTKQDADSCERPNSQERRIQRNQHPRRHVTKNGASIKVEKPSADRGNGAIALRSRRTNRTQRLQERSVRNTDDELIQRLRESDHILTEIGKTGLPWTAATVITLAIPVTVTIARTATSTRARPAAVTITRPVTIARPITIA